MIRKQKINIDKFRERMLFLKRSEELFVKRRPILAKTEAERK